MSEHGNISALLALPDRFADLDIWVVGDLMLDEYVTGTVERISPEAPVPVVCARATEHRLGGAANVARRSRLSERGSALPGSAARMPLAMSCCSCVRMPASTRARY